MAGDRFFGVDMGGTTIRVQEVEPATGTLLGDAFTHPMEMVRSNGDLTSLVLPLFPHGSHIGVIAAGKNDEVELLNMPTNAAIKETITLARDLRDAGHFAVLTNDLRGAVSAEARWGQGRRFRNVLVATYSSGYNCAKTADGIVVTDAEFGHLVYKPNGDLFCGCGEVGHLEVYISGNGAATRAQQYLQITKRADHPLLQIAARERGHRDAQSFVEAVGYPNAVSQVKCEHVYAAFSEHPEMEPMRDIVEQQRAAVGLSFGHMISAFNPVDILILMGGNTNNWNTLIEPAMQMYNSRGYQLPAVQKVQVVRTQMPEIGVQGAVAYLLSKRGEVHGPPAQRLRRGLETVM